MWIAENSLCSKLTPQRQLYYSPKCRAQGCNTYKLQWTLRQIVVMNDDAMEGLKYRPQLVIDSTSMHVRFTFMSTYFISIIYLFDGYIYTSSVNSGHLYW